MLYKWIKKAYKKLMWIKYPLYVTMSTQTNTQTAGTVRPVTVNLTRWEIDALNRAAARLGLTALEMLSLAAVAEMKNRAALIA